MYVKLVMNEDRKGCSSKNLREEVVPHTDIVFECDRVSFTKYGMGDGKNFEDSLKGKDHTVLCPEWFFDPVFGARFLYEFVYFGVEKDGEWNYYASPACSLYIMNDRGKTIDYVVCLTEIVMADKEREAFVAKELNK